MSELDQPYDPDPLEVGTPVRVRLGGECRFTGSGDWPHRDVVSGECGELFHLDARHDEYPWTATHPYCVDFGIATDERLAGGLIRLTEHRTARFARAELERLS